MQKVVVGIKRVLKANVFNLLFLCAYRSLPVLAGIAPSDIRRAVASRTERTRQTMDERHLLNGHLGVAYHA